MNCREARLHIGAEPASLPQAVAEHVAGCADCSQLLQAALGFEGNLRRAFALAPPSLRSRTAPGPSPPIVATNVAPIRPPMRATRSQRWLAPRWALAASVLAAVALAILLWTGKPTDTLAADVVAHMAEEPNSWTATAELPRERVDRILAQAGARLDAGSNQVVYANSCWFRGHYVPHLVVTTDAGPVTVLVLRSERMPRPQRISAGGYEGTLMPFGPGSLAVLGRGDQMLTDAVLQRLQRSLHWLS